MHIILSMIKSRRFIRALSLELFREYIFKLMRDPKLYKDMSTNARNSTYKYSKEVFASEVLKVYHKAIEKKSNSKKIED